MFVKCNNKDFLKIYTRFRLFKEDILLTNLNISS